MTVAHNRASTAASANRVTPAIRSVAEGVSDERVCDLIDGEAGGVLPRWERLERAPVYGYEIAQSFDSRTLKA